LTDILYELAYLTQRCLMLQIITKSHLSRRLIKESAQDVRFPNNCCWKFGSREVSRHAEW